MKVSIITISLNSSQTIEHCIRSVDRQTYPDIEHIIVDGGSNDETVEKIQNTGGRVSRIISEPDKGIYDALNKGIALATGEIIGILHSDDYFATEETIAKIVAKFEEGMNSGKIDGVYGDLEYVKTETEEKRKRYWKSIPFNPEEIKKGWMPPHNTLFLRSDVYIKHGNFDINYKIASDIDFMIRVFRDDTLRFEYIPEVITKMRVGGASNKPGNFILKNREYLQVIRKNEVGGIETLVRKLVGKVWQYILFYK